MVNNQPLLSIIGSQEEDKEHLSVAARTETNACFLTQHIATHCDIERWQTLHSTSQACLPWRQNRSPGRQNPSWQMTWKTCWQITYFLTDRWPDKADKWPDIADRWPDIDDRWPDIADRWPILTDIADRWPNTADRWPNKADRWPDIADRWLDVADRGPYIADWWPDLADRWPEYSWQMPDCHFIK